MKRKDHMMTKAQMGSENVMGMSSGFIWLRTGNSGEVS
jgi:hypothetical protein